MPYSLYGISYYITWHQTREGAQKSMLYSSTAVPTYYNDTIYILVSRRERGGWVGTYHTYRADQRGVGHEGMKPSHLSISSALDKYHFVLTTFTAVLCVFTYNIYGVHYMHCIPVLLSYLFMNVCWTCLAYCCCTQAVLLHSSNRTI